MNKKKNLKNYLDEQKKNLKNKILMNSDNNKNYDKNNLEIKNINNDNLFEIFNKGFLEIKDFINIENIYDVYNLEFDNLLQIKDISYCEINNNNNLKIQNDINLDLINKIESQNYFKNRDFFFIKKCLKNGSIIRNFELENISFEKEIPIISEDIDELTNFGREILLKIKSISSDKNYEDFDDPEISEFIKIIFTEKIDNFLIKIDKKYIGLIGIKNNIEEETLYFKYFIFDYKGNLNFFDYCRLFYNILLNLKKYYKISKNNFINFGYNISFQDNEDFFYKIVNSYYFNFFLKELKQYNVWGEKKFSNFFENYYNLFENKNTKGKYLKFIINYEEFLQKLFIITIYVYHYNFDERMSISSCNLELNDNYTVEYILKKEEIRKKINEILDIFYLLLYAKDRNNKKVFSKREIILYKAFDFLYGTDFRGSELFYSMRRIK